jgi:hypothetical protein
MCPETCPGWQIVFGNLEYRVYIRADRITDITRVNYASGSDIADTH